ncbi:class F sortase [Patescibacteria group bacterium]|nr:MAG: class F sortase [Patescibacteria group bacterium]
MRTERHAKLALRVALASLTIVVFGFGMYVSVQGFIQNRRVAEGVPTTAQASQEQEAEAPSETKPDDNSVANYQVAPDMPRFISIESQGIKARVLRIGLTGDGAVGAPNNVHDGGWYEGSAKPGEGGVSLIVGHVSGISAPGVFRNIDQLNPGEVISVERGDGTVIRYRVDATESFPANNVDMAKALSYSKVEGGEALNLITCHGSFDGASQQYTERLVVYTTRI